MLLLSTHYQKQERLLGVGRTVVFRTSPCSKCWGRTGLDAKVEALLVRLGRSSGGYEWHAFHSATQAIVVRTHPPKVEDRNKPALPLHKGLLEPAFRCEAFRGLEGDRGDGGDDGGGDGGGTAQPSNSETQ